MVSTQPINVRVRMSLSMLEHANLLPLVRAIARQYGTTVEAIVGDRRLKSIAHARHAAWYAVYNHGARSFSYPEIGRMFNRDHSTVMSGCARHVARLAGEAGPAPLVGRAAAAWPDCLPPMGYPVVVEEHEPLMVAPPLASCSIAQPQPCEPRPGLQRVAMVAREEQVGVA